MLDLALETGWIYSYHDSLEFFEGSVMYEPQISML